MHSLIFFEYLYLEKGSLLSEAYFTGFGAKNQFTKIIPYFILFLLLQLTHSHWNFENPWSLQGSEAKRRFCLHLGQASTSRPAGTIICLGDKICGSSNIVHWGVIKCPLRFPVRLLQWAAFSCSRGMKSGLPELTDREMHRLPRMCPVNSKVYKFYWR